MIIEFEKWHGCHNDFILTQIRSTETHVLSALKNRAYELCARKATGIGADGFIVVEYDSMRIHIINSDGSIARTCGNGLRCATQFMLQNSQESDIEFILSQGEKTVCEKLGPYVSVDMGSYSVTPEWYSTSLNERINQCLKDSSLNHDGFECIDVTNPHIVIRSSEFFSLATVGEHLQKVVPGGVNVHFMTPYSDSLQSLWPKGIAVEKDDAIEMKSYERGVGLTQACGSGACACVIAEKMQGFMAANTYIPVRMPGGVVVIKAYEDQVTMVGPAQKVYQGRIEI